MSDRRLIAFDLGGTLESWDGQPVHDDLRPALEDYAALHPDTHFGIATNGGLEPARQFVQGHGVEEIFTDTTSQELLIAYPGQLVITSIATTVPAPANWRERLTGRFTGSEPTIRDHEYHLRAKPAPDMLNHLIARVAVGAEQTVFVGDDPYDDLICAQEAGARFLSCNPFENERPDSMAALLERAHALFPEC